MLCRKDGDPMKLIHELALGNLQPMARNFKKDSVYAKLLAKVTDWKQPGTVWRAVRFTKTITRA